MGRQFLVAVMFSVFTVAPATVQDPVTVDATHTKLEFENDQIRVLRFHLGPHEKSPMHQHPDRVFVFLTDAHTRVTVAGNKAEERGGKAGEVHHRPAERHAVENLNGQDYESIIIELKPQKAQ